MTNLWLFNSKKKKKEMELKGKGIKSEKKNIA